ncbi:MAG: amidase [Polyangiaceae bacterium]|nr:amidase [Polyangiaceae bacterium]
MKDTISLLELPDLRTIAAELRDKRRSCVYLARAAIAARTASTDSVGPYVTWSVERVDEQAIAADRAMQAGIDAGPLHGIPLSIKDLFGIRGWPTYAGTSSRLPTRFEVEGGVVSGLKSQFCIVVGKTHMVELAFGGLGTNSHWGTPRNPCDSTAHRVPGGSSSGAGVSLVEGSALAALGTDTAGSVRIPASMTGTVGLKTTAGRWPTNGIVPLSSTFDSIGVLARSVRDVAYVYEAVERAIGRVPKVPKRDLSRYTFAVPDRFFREGMSPGIDEAFDGGLATIARAGAKLVPIKFQEAEEAYEIFKNGGLAGAEVGAFFADELPDRVASLELAVRDRIASASSLSAVEYIQRRRSFTRLSIQAQEAMQDVDALLTPTVAISPPLVCELEDLENYRKLNLLALRNTSVGNLLSMCALTLPVGRDKLGLPVGMQVLAVGGTELDLLGMGIGLEAALDFHRN